jgi:all-trans-8'-apo-beta-carotenal 15,15'-oxygenase
MVEILFGKVPLDIAGTLYRNGPGMFRRTNARVGHFFDGDGRVDSIRFSKGTVTPLSKFVETEHFVVEQELDTFLYRGAFGSTYRKGQAFEMKNPSNTSVVFRSHGSPLLSMWEGGAPYEMCPETLETQGISAAFGASPRRSLFTTGLSAIDEAFQLGGWGVGAHPTRFKGRTTFLLTQVSLGHTTLKFHTTEDVTNSTVDELSVRLNGFTHVHSFSETEKYFVVCATPFTFHVGDFLFHNKGIQHTVSHTHHQPSSMVFIDKATKKITNIRMFPFYATHFLNAFENENGVVTVKCTGCVRLNLEDVPDIRFYTFTFDVLNGFMLSYQRVYDHLSEFPVMSQGLTGKYNRYSYFSSASTKHSALNTYTRHDAETHTVEHFDISSRLKNNLKRDPIFYLEPVLVRGDVSHIEYLLGTHLCRRGPLLSLTDAASLDTVCVLLLRGVNPFPLHSTWAPHPTQ